MKKVFYFAAPLFMATVLFFSCTAQTPKASYKTTIDSLSFAVGIGQTEGLTYFYEQQGIDSAHIKDFLKGLAEGLSSNKDNKSEAARQAGINVGRQIASTDIKQLTAHFFPGQDSTFVLNEKNVLAGFYAGAAKTKTWISALDARSYADSIRNTYNEKNKAKQLAWLTENKINEGVVETLSGLQYKVIKEGTGPKPTSSDRVKVDYVGTLIDGTEFDSSIKRGQPAEFLLSGVISGWTEGLQLMPVGSEYELYIPYQLGYGERGSGNNIPPYATLIFKVTLHDIVTPPVPGKK